MDSKDQEIKKHIEDLKAKIIEWNKAYYDLDDPKVDDEIYDQAMMDLMDLESKYRYLFSMQELLESPTNKIGANASNIFAKVEHKVPMLSLEKAYSKQEVSDWIDSVKKVCKDPTFFVEPKIDGLSISLHYRNGRLFQALTRGNGNVGEDVTHNILINDEIPKVIDYEDEIEIRGEVYIRIDEFNRVNALLELEGKKPLLNPRNGAAGTLRRKEQPKDQRRLSVFCYSIVNPQKHNLHTIADIRAFLRKMQLPVTKEEKHVKNLDEIFNWIDEFKEVKKTLNYETDGAVVKLNELEYYDLLGQTQKFPRWAIAFKYDPQVVQTKILNITTSVGKSGIITYRAELEPKMLSGSLISAATLHNYDYISKLNIDINDWVFIKKAGEIIPRVIETVQSKTSTNFKKITHCSSCGSELVDSETEMSQYCINDDCPEMNKNKLIYFVSKPAMNIEFFAEKTVEKFIDEGLIKEFKDIYFLKDKKEQLYTYKTVHRKSLNADEKIITNQRSVDKLLESIEKSRQNPLDSLLNAISIEFIGEKSSYFLASQIKEFKNLLTFDFTKLIEFDEIGPKTVEALQKFVANQKNQKMINDLCDIGLNLLHVSKIKSLKLAGISFVITGSLSEPRKVFEKEIISYGAKLSSTVSQNTVYVVAGQNPTKSKIDKATKLGIKIINEEELKQILQS